MKNNQDIKAFQKHGVLITDNDLDFKQKHKKDHKRIQHKHILRQMLKAIDRCPMDQELKMILRLRLWGKNTNCFGPLTVRQISEEWGVRKEVIADFENEGKKRLQDYLERFHVSDIELDYMKNKMGNKSVLLSKSGMPLTDQHL